MKGTLTDDNQSHELSIDSCHQTLLYFLLFLSVWCMPADYLCIYPLHPTANSLLTVKFLACNARSMRAKGFMFWDELMVYKPLITKSGHAGFHALNWLWLISKHLNLKWWSCLHCQQIIQVFSNYVGFYIGMLILLRVIDFIDIL